MSSLLTANEETMQAHERRGYNRMLRKICIGGFILLAIPVFAITRLYTVTGHATFTAFGAVVLLAVLIYAVYRFKKKAQKVTFYRH